MRRLDIFTAIYNSILPIGACKPRFILNATSFLEYHAKLDELEG